MTEKDLQKVSDAVWHSWACCGVRPAGAMLQPAAPPREQIGANPND